jgi:uncharacterized membrane protein YqiK
VRQASRVNPKLADRGFARSTIRLVPKATSPRGRSTAGKVQSTERKAAKVVESAQAEAKRVRAAANADAARIRAEAERIRADAEEHARGLILDARATADGVRAEGMEIVSNLRQMSDSLRVNAERLLTDIQSIHSRMVGELERVEPGGDTGLPSGAADAEERSMAEPSTEEELDVPDFVQQR